MAKRKFLSINLGAVLARAGKTGEAIESFRVALRLKPDSKEVRSDLERVLTVTEKP